MKYVVAIFFVMVGMGILIGLVKALAKIIIYIALIGAIVLMCYAISEENLSWKETILGSLIAGGLAGLVCIPLLPFSGLLEDMEEGEQKKENDKDGWDAEDWKKIWNDILILLAAFKKKFIAWVTGKKLEDIQQKKDEGTKN